MAKQTAEIVPGEVTQEQWDAKYAATTEALKDLGGADSKDADDLPESTTKKWAGETGATLDQADTEIRDLIVALVDNDRKILITDPQIGECKILALHRNAAGNLEYDYDDVPES